jgi:hypothetical protein
VTENFDENYENDPTLAVKKERVIIFMVITFSVFRLNTSVSWVFNCNHNVT